MKEKFLIKKKSIKKLIISIIFFKIILFLKVFKYVKLSKCEEKDKPFLKEEECYPTCTIEEINDNLCKLENDIIKNQWLNNIINFGEISCSYINVATSEKNDLFCLSSCYPQSNSRTFYILNNEGYGYKNEENPFLRTEINDGYTNGRFESELFTIKLYESKDNKEYLVSLSKSIQNIEIYDFYQDTYYFDSVANAFGGLNNIFQYIGVHLKLELASKENKNTYLIGILACKYYGNYGEIQEPNFFIFKTNFTSINIKDNPIEYNFTTIKTSYSRLISCYETKNNFIVCFYQNPEYEYTVIVLDYELEEKTHLKIANGYSGYEYENWYFKCVHFFDETGVFGYFTNNDNPKLIFEFKKFYSNNNTIVDSFLIRQIKFNNNDLSYSLPTICDMIKLDEKKIYFASPSNNKEILTIISIFNYDENKLSVRIYNIYTNNLYNYVFNTYLKLTSYNNLIAMGAAFNENWSSYSSLIIFSYPQTEPTFTEIYSYLYYHDDTKIYNLDIELEGKYSNIDNNIFGLVYSGVAIIENCRGLEDVYLTDLNNKKIVSIYQLPKKEKIKLIIPRQDYYDRFVCQFKYAVMVSEPTFSEFKANTAEYFDSGDVNKEEELFDNLKTNYIGKSKNYELILNVQLTELNCEENCELCKPIEDNNAPQCVSCKYSSHFDENNIKICENNTKESEFGETEGVKTDGLNDKNSNEINKDQNKTFEVCTLDEILVNKCSNEIDQNQINYIYSYIKKNLISSNHTLIKTDNVIFEVSEVNEQKNSDNKNISSIDLGICEQRIREIYDIHEPDELIIFKIDIKNLEQSTTYVQYEIYDPYTLEQIQLDICEDTDINIYTPVYLDSETEELFSSLKESGYDLFNSNNSFYKDLCTPYTTKNGTDILLNDRYNDIYKKNGAKNLCQKDCELIYYNEISQKAKCNCQPQNNITNLNIFEILLYDDDRIKEIFINAIDNSNFKVMKCYKLAFSLKTILKNIGRIIMTIIYFIFFIMLIFYFFKENKKLEIYISQILQQKMNLINKRGNKNSLLNHSKKLFKNSDKKNKQIRYRAHSVHKKNVSNKNFNNNSNNIFNDYKRNDNNNINSHKSHKRFSNFPNINNIDDQTNEDNLKKQKKDNFQKSISLKMISDKSIKNNEDDNPKNMKPNNFSVPPKKKKISTIPEVRNKSTITSIDKPGTNQNIILSNNIYIKMNKGRNKNKKSLKGLKYSKDSIISSLLKKESNHLTKALDNFGKKDKYGKNGIAYFTNEELNRMDYQKALIHDKRTYFQYYCSLVRKKQIILFVLINNDDYNLISIKLSLLLISFSLYFTLNGFFFNDNTMHKLYLNNGSYDFIAQIPIICYTTMITTIINIILRTLSLSEKDILKIKHESNFKGAKYNANESFQCLKLKISIFFLLSLLLMSFFWYFISCFCAVYNNTQFTLIDDTLISFGLSMIYPFGIYLIPGIFRIPALRANSKDKECLYKVSVLISLL